MKSKCCVCDVQVLTGHLGEYPVYQCMGCLKTCGVIDEKKKYIDDVYFHDNETIEDQIDTLTDKLNEIIDWINSHE